MKHRESRLQAKCVTWFRNNYRQYAKLLFKNNNEYGVKKNPRQAASLKAQGLTAGVPDLTLAKPSKGYHGAYIELKSPDRKAEPSPTQKRMIEMLEAQGYFCAVVNTEAQFQEIVMLYLGEDPHDPVSDERGV